MYLHKIVGEEYPFMFANLDGVINKDGEFYIFEAKTASAYKQEVWEEGIPAPYILQVQHYMAAFSLLASTMLLLTGFHVTVLPPTVPASASFR